MARLGDRERALALRDALTGCFNRRAFYRLFRREADRARRLGAGLSLLSLDIDNFKSVNDAYGHGSGDEVLRLLARRLLGLVREPDLLFRWGGEEFLILLPHSVPGAAVHLAERVRAGVAAEPFRVGEEGREVPLTISIGVAGMETRDGGLDADALAERADAALLRAKREGRNRVVSVASDDSRPLAS
jgi:two-component system cell cycle response regulator